MGGSECQPLSGLNLVVTRGQNVLGLGTPGAGASSDSPLSPQGSITMAQKGPRKMPVVDE